MLPSSPSSLPYLRRRSSDNLHVKSEETLTDPSKSFSKKPEESCRIFSASVQPEWDMSRPNASELIQAAFGPVIINNVSSTHIMQTDLAIFQQNSTGGSGSDTTGGETAAAVAASGLDADGVRTSSGHEPEPTSRVIFLNRPQPSRFCSNRITTAKYCILSFFPIFLFEQFRRYSNIFFLFIALLQQIPDVSPTGRYTTLVPLVFILSVSALKEIVEDYKRHMADKETNHRETQILRDDRWEYAKWIDVSVGDIVKVNNNQFFPSDLVLLASSEPEGICFIETSNLDGETNLKVRQGLASTARLTETKDIAAVTGNIECEQPNRHLYEFNGVFRISGQQAVAVGPDQVLLRGAMLRNTNWIFGLAIYTGHESKLMKNSTRAPLKRSSVDKITNTQILMLFFMLIVLCLLSAVFNQLWTTVHFNKDWYMNLDESGSRGFGYNLLTFIILYNNLIPISLQVSLEVVRFLQATFINMDLEMYNEETDTPAMARTSNLNEELGMVKYIFSDKTGTLTRNVMEFKKCSIAEIVYESGDPTLVKNYKENHKTANYIKEFMELLSVCHTVIPEKVDDELVYHAASPDERALVNGARNFGWCFKTRTPNYVKVEVLGEIEEFEILNVLEFTSKRKRMSVIIRNAQGVIKLFCKGADTVIYERLKPQQQQQMRENTLKQLEEFATEGLRTLCCAYAIIPDETYDDWKQTYHKASTAITDREAKVEEASNLIEIDLMLLGATAIEDKLQDQVPETIAALIKADMHVWVLTGDKQETAINIGYSCCLLSPGMPLLLLNEDSLDATRARLREHLTVLNSSTAPSSSSSSSSPSPNVRQKQAHHAALVIDGNTLKYALTCDLRSDLLELCTSCNVVICCRVSPIQKAEVVELVTTMTKSVTLAIGDGANDVAMIQKAHVGVGISGMEGLQAACASDYSIAQFKYLVKLLLVHGAWNYDRMCKLILYSFYKNISLYVIELWFAIYSGWSGQILFERWTIGLYNVLFTAAPPLALGIFDKVCSSEARICNPILYKPSQTSQCFNVQVFWIWIGNSLLHSVILFWLPLLAVHYGIIWPGGGEGGYLVLGNIVYTYVVITVCFKAGLITSSWTWVTHLAIWGSIGLWFLFVLIYSNFWPTIPIAAVMLGQDRMVFSSLVFWCGLIVIPLAALLLDVAIKVIIGGTLFKSTTDQIRENEIRQKVTTHIVPAESTTTLSETARLLRTVKSAFTKRSSTSGTAAAANTELELAHGYAFSQEEGGAFTQTQMIRAYDTTRPKPDGL